MTYEDIVDIIRHDYINAIVLLFTDIENGKIAANDTLYQIYQEWDEFVQYINNKLEYD